MRTNYVLIDYENVQPSSLASLDLPHVRVFVFIGASQTKVAVDLAMGLQHLGERACYVKASGNGNNALDFHISFYIGQLSEKDPGGFFHIVSKDTGFDPLIAHLKSRSIYSKRSKDISGLAFIKIGEAKSEPDRVKLVVENLRARGSSRPRTLKTLSTTVASLFQKALSHEDLEKLIKALQKSGVVTVTDSKVSYAFPG
jgi:hypothetical protein